MKKILLTFAALALAVPAWADVIRLTNGSTVEGTYLGGDSREVKFLRSNGSVKTYAVSDVASLAFGEDATVAEAPAAPVAPKTTTASQSGNVIPSGTAITVRMIDSIDSDVTGVGERFRASLEEAIVVDGRELAPRGSDVMVEVAKVEQAGRVRGREEVAVELVALTVNGKELAVNSNYAEVEGKSKTKETAKTAGGGAALGAIIGAIAGGGKGAAIGAGVGAGAGTVYSATRGQTVRIPSETLLTFSLREDLAM